MTPTQQTEQNELIRYPVHTTGCKGRVVDAACREICKCSTDARAAELVRVLNAYDEQLKDLADMPFLHAEIDRLNLLLDAPNKAAREKAKQEQSSQPAPVAASGEPSGAAMKTWKVDDLIRISSYGGKFRVWRVIGIFLGGENQESVIEIETLDRSVNTQGRMCVPEELLNARTIDAAERAEAAERIRQLEQSKVVWKQTLTDADNRVAELQQRLVAREKAVENSNVPPDREFYGWLIDINELLTGVNCKSPWQVSQHSRKEMILDLQGRAIAAERERDEARQQILEVECKHRIDLNEAKKRIQQEIDGHNEHVGLWITRNNTDHKTIAQLCDRINALEGLHATQRHNLEFLGKKRDQLRADLDEAVGLLRRKQAQQCGEYFSYRTHDEHGARLTLAFLDRLDSKPSDPVVLPGIQELGVEPGNCSGVPNSSPPEMALPKFPFDDETATESDGGKKIVGVAIEDIPKNESGWVKCGDGLELPESVRKPPEPATESGEKSATDWKLRCEISQARVKERDSAIARMRNVIHERDAEIAELKKLYSFDEPETETAHEKEIRRKFLDNNGPLKGYPITALTVMDLVNQVNERNAEINHMKSVLAGIEKLIHSSGA